MIHAIRRALRLSDENGAAAILLDLFEDDALKRRLKAYADLCFSSVDDPVNSISPGCSSRWPMRGLP